MALFGRKKTTVGLDIGSGLVKVAVIDHSKSEPELMKVAITPLLADAIVEGEIMDPWHRRRRGTHGARAGGDQDQGHEGSRDRGRWP